MFDYHEKSAFEPGSVFQFSNELEKASPIFFGFDIEEHFCHYLERLTRSAPADRLFLLTDRFLFDLFGSNFLTGLINKFPNAKICFLPQGERSKTFDVLTDICDQLIEKGVSKSSVLVAFGGGSVGNLTGLAAGLVFRGIRFIEVPTTLLHQTDGTLSNKQAVNGKHGKNHFGFFYAPIFTWTDTKYLETEPIVFRKAGIVEGIKNALIDQSAFLSYLEDHIRQDGDYSPEMLTDLARKLMESKLQILKKDPTEKRYALILEYGHTFAHAIEWLSKGSLTHGESVSIGMKIAAELSLKLDYIDTDLVTLHYALIDDKLAIEAELPQQINSSSIMKTLFVDNKKTGQDLRFVLLGGMGKCVKVDNNYLVSVDKNIVKDVIERFIENGCLAKRTKEVHCQWMT